MDGHSNRAAFAGEIGHPQCFQPVSARRVEATFKDASLRRVTKNVAVYIGVPGRAGEAEGPVDKLPGLRPLSSRPGDSRQARQRKRVYSLLAGVLRHLKQFNVRLLCSLKVIGKQRREPKGGECGR